MNNAPVVRLLVNGMDYNGWKSVRITMGIERTTRDFSLDVTDKWPGDVAVVNRIKPGDLCELYVDFEKILTGYVDATPISYDSSSCSISIRGRSKTADLVDCSAISKPAQWKNQSLTRIAQELAAPYGVKVIAKADVGRPFTDHQIQQGESVFESIDRMLAQRQLLATDDAEGNLVFTTAGLEGTATPLRLGEPNGNILNGSAELDFKDRFSEYICKGQMAGDDSQYGAATNQTISSLADSTVKRRRVMVVKQSGQADEGTCRDRVNYERASRRTQSLMATYTVPGWRQIDGKLWLPNFLVQVDDEIIGFTRQMLISEVTYELSDAGMLTTLRVGPPEGFIAEPNKSKKKKKGKKAGGDSWSSLELSDDEDDGDE